MKVCTYIHNYAFVFIIMSLFKLLCSYVCLCTCVCMYACMDTKVWKLCNLKHSLLGLLVRLIRLKQTEIVAMSKGQIVAYKFFNVSDGDFKTSLAYNIILWQTSSAFILAVPLLLATHTFD